MEEQKLGRVGLVLKGGWLSTTDYVALDLVAYDGNAWAAKRPNKNVEPTTENSNDWQLISNNSDLVATVQGYKNDAASSASAAAASALDSAASAIKGKQAQSMISPPEASSTASTAHAKGSYFVYNGKMYQATGNIASGASIVTTGSGQNCAEVNVGQQVYGISKTLERSCTSGVVMGNYGAGEINVSGLGSGVTVKHTNRNMVYVASRNGEDGGITFTPNSDGSVTMNGTTSKTDGAGNPTFSSSKTDPTYNTSTLVTLPPGKYTLSGCIKDADGETVAYSVLFGWYMDNDHTPISESRLQTNKKDIVEFTTTAFFQAEIIIRVKGAKDELDEQGKFYLGQRLG